MADKDTEFLNKLLATFRVEANEHLEAMASELLGLEKAPTSTIQPQFIERIFREAHSLKGAARAVNLLDVESVCHALESLFAALRSATASAMAVPFDLLHETLGTLGGLLASDAAEKPPIATLIRRLEDASREPAPADEAPLARAGATEQRLTVPAAEQDVVPRQAMVPPPFDPGRATVRVAAAKLDTALRQAEELLAPRLAASQRVLELREAGAEIAAWKKARAAIQPVLRALRRLTPGASLGNDNAGERRNLAKLLDHLEAEDNAINAHHERLARLEKAASRDRRTLAGMVDDLLHDVKELHLSPFGSLLDPLPRIARELARDRGKQVELTVRGGDIEIDRRILDELKDPLIHLLRNCIDHGIEKPDERARRNKPAHGTIALFVSQRDGGKVELRVADDGAGIDVEKLKTAAGRLGLLSADELERLDEPQALALAFRSGISTSPFITDLSGRGLGLPIVREKIERLGGTIALSTRAEQGTTFRIVLPLELATLRGVSVRAGTRIFVIPTTGVQRVTRLAGHELRTVENRETIPLDGQAVALVRLDEVLELPQAAATDADDRVLAVILGLDQDRVAFRVDEVLGEQEVLVKALGPQLARVRNLAGACVLGTGQVVPVLNVSDLLRSAVRAPSAGRAPPAVAEIPTQAAKRSILVVEDSITSRTLLKGILESAGYRVTTAVDGIDAYTALKTETFDLMVSDVEMPRMDGFDLSTRVRADKQLAELPIVLVTALESREHRERGIDVGANAYIVKSSFDQSNLLEVVRRLI